MFMEFSLSEWRGKSESWRKLKGGERKRGEREREREREKMRERETEKGERKHKQVSPLSVWLEMYNTHGKEKAAPSRSEEGRIN